MYLSATTMLLAVLTAVSLIIIPVKALVALPFPPGAWPSHNGPTFQPFLQGNFADPSIIEVDGVIYTFSTSSSGVNVPIANQPNGKSIQRLEVEPNHLRDALPNLPKWSSGNIWAPHVVQLADGTFVLYFAGEVAGNGKHCIGAAAARDVTGPYMPIDTALACPLDQGGAIDPAGFTDSDGSLYVVYKIDGNSLPSNPTGTCGNGDGKHDTFLMLQQLESDGTTTHGDPVPLLNRDAKDGPLIEAPSLVKSSDGTYVLFFSSNCYNSEFYDVSYATSSSLKGPYTKTAAPLLLPGDHGLLSPGGATITTDGKTIVYHADLKYKDASVRQMYMNSVAISGTKVTLTQLD